MVFVHYNIFITCVSISITFKISIVLWNFFQMLNVLCFLILYFDSFLFLLLFSWHFSVGLAFASLKIPLNSTLVCHVIHKFFSKSWIHLFHLFLSIFCILCIHLWYPFFSHPQCSLSIQYIRSSQISLHLCFRVLFLFSI